VLNLGGRANPDVLLVRRAGAPPVVVKDWSRRGALVRGLIAPLLASHELAMLERCAGVRGVPRPGARIDRLALSLEFVDGRPLRRRTHGRALPAAFFTALEEILAGLARRGVVYLDLRSPSNVLVTPGLEPALVDLGSALALPLPRALRASLERRALAKLRARFEGSDSPAPLAADPGRDLKAGGTRFRVRERGSVEDPVPLVFLADVGVSSRLYEPLLSQAEARGRRALGVDLPGFGGSRRKVASLAPSHVAAQLESLLAALRLPQLDLVAAGWAALPAAELLARFPRRVRRLFAIDALGARADAEAIADPPRDSEVVRARLTKALPACLAPELRAELAAELARADGRNLLLADASAAHAVRTRHERRIDLDWSEALAGAIFAG
jgi:pimeloyl-ACP methyl ester carboxylesterase